MSLRVLLFRPTAPSVLASPAMRPPRSPPGGCHTQAVGLSLQNPCGSCEGPSYEAATRSAGLGLTLTGAFSVEEADTSVIWKRPRQTPPEGEARGYQRRPRWWGAQPGEARYSREPGSPTGQGSTAPASSSGQGSWSHRGTGQEGQDRRARPAGGSEGLRQTPLQGSHPSAAHFRDWPNAPSKA